MVEREVKAENLPLVVKLVFIVVRVVNFFLDLISNRLPFSISVILTSFVIALPIAGVWYVFLIGNYLPFPWGAVLIWSLTFLVVILAAAVDYVRTS
jgi:membrane-bound acyltransferase YfiQ involved in biofilm formation